MYIYCAHTAHICRTPLPKHPSAGSRSLSLPKCFQPLGGASILLRAAFLLVPTGESALKIFLYLLQSAQIISSADSDVL